MGTAMRRREAEQLDRWVRIRPPRIAPRWLTPEQVIAATPLDGLDPVARSQMRATRVLLLTAVARRAIADIREKATSGPA